MRSRRSRRATRLALVGGGAAAVLAIGAVLVARDRDPPPASPEVLNRVATRNQDAAIEAAARMKAESAASAEAADARLRAQEAEETGPP